MTDETKKITLKDICLKNNFKSNSPDLIIMDDLKEESEHAIDFDAADFDFVEDSNSDTNSTPTFNKSPKDTLIVFLRDSVLDEEYHLKYNGDYSGAETFLHRMRVELSRFRAQIIKMNKKLNHFHILKKEIVVHSETNCTIILIKTNTRKRLDAPKEILDVLDFLTTE